MTGRVWLKATKQIGQGLYEHQWTGTPVDPLDVEYDGYPLRSLLSLDAAARRENVIGQVTRSCMTPLQRAVISACWSAEVRVRVARTAAEDAARRPSVLVELDDP